MQQAEVLNLFMRHQARYKAFAYTLALDWSIAEDAVQEAAIFVCDRYTDFEAGTNFDAWVRTIVRNRCREIFRREHREKAKAQKMSTLIPEAIWDQVTEPANEKAQALRGCLEQLPQKTKSIVKMFYGEQKKCDAISELIQSSEEAVYKILSRVRKSLKTCIESKIKGVSQ